MKDDMRVRELVRAALPPTGDEMISGDLWQRFSRHESAGPPIWSRLDLALLAAVALMLWLMPGAWVMLVHQL